LLTVICGGNAVNDRSARSLSVGTGLLAQCFEILIGRRDARRRHRQDACATAWDAAAVSGEAWALELEAA